MLLSGHSNLLLRIFSFIGIAPFAKTKNIPNLGGRIVHYFPMFFSSLLSLLLTIFLLIFPHFKSLGTIHTIINFSYVWSLFLTIFSANCQCHFYKSVYYRTNYRIRQIQKRYKEKSVTKFIHTFQLRYRIKVLVIFILFFGSQILVFVEVWLISETRGLWSSLTASFVTSLLRILYPMHIFHVVLHCDILAMFVKNLNLEARKSALSFSLSVEVEFLKNIKSMHMELSKLVDDINSFFGWNLLFLIINSFIYISYQLYWIFLSLQLHWGMLAIIDGMVSLSYGTVSLFILVNSCQSCSLEMKVLVKNVEQKFFWTNNNVWLYQLKREVFNQIKFLPLYITAHEYFNIDRKFLATITTSCCMYILVFIQFFLTVKG